MERGERNDNGGVRVVGATLTDTHDAPDPAADEPVAPRASDAATATTDRTDVAPSSTRRAGRHRGDADADAPPPRTDTRRAGGPPSAPTRRGFRVVAALAVLGLLGTIVFGVLYATSGSSAPAQNPAVNQAAQAFLTDFFNFNAKTVDADFTAVTNMATGQFATQAKQFFNTSIRQALEKALAESRGQTRALYVQSETGSAATLYAVVDQTYVNNKITSPQADVVRLVMNLADVGGTWKISNVTVLEGATPGSAGSASGSAGSSVPGQ